ncbi:unnamed protein product, partial [Amoebophrya sp. A25]|eukprot:GSA25T00002679001.1
MLQRQEIGCLKESILGTPCKREMKRKKEMRWMKRPASSGYYLLVKYIFQEKHAPPMLILISTSDLTRSTYEPHK